MLASLAAAAKTHSASLKRHEELLERILAVLDGLDRDRGGHVEPHDEVISENQAVERLPFAKSTARRWLRRERLSVAVLTPGECRKREVRVVVWVDVLERLRRDEDAVAAPPPARRRTPPVTSLGVPGRLDDSSR